MEILHNINDKLKTINEKNTEYIDVLKRPDLVHGLVSPGSENVDFSKTTYTTRATVSEFGASAESEMNNLFRSASGNQLVFKSNSTSIIIKAELKRAFGYRKMMLWNSSGFDVYEIRNGVYQHCTVFAPTEGKTCFAERIVASKGSEVCIFLPNYNCINKLYLGVDKGCVVEPVFSKQLPIVFYGNSVTQGASASRSSNSFVNLIYKRMHSDVINLSISSCCRGQSDMARMIGQINCRAIVVDYTRNAYNAKVFTESFGRFYKELRKWHPDKKIILMTSACFNHWVDFYEYDEIVKKTYNKAVESGDNTYLLDQRSLFSEEEYDFVTVDGSHYIDYGMFKVADALCRMLSE